MNTGHELFEDEASQRRVEQLLRTTFAAPPMSADYVNRISQQLDREFASSSSEVNGVAHAEPVTIPISQAATTRRSTLRIFGTAVAAAALLVAVGLWSDRPAYGWAAMIQALEGCDWVQAITRPQANGGEPAAIGWFSKSAQVAAREEGQARVYLNFQTNTAENFNPTDQTIYQHGLTKPSQLSGELLALLVGMKDQPTALANVDATNLEVVEESWREVLEENDKFIELQVTLRQKNNELLRLVFVLDPETQLPLSGRVLDERQRAKKSLEFSYPQQGPDSIFALGVPREAKVVVSSLAKPVAVALAGVEQPESAVVVEELVVAAGPESPTAQPTTDTPTQSTAPAAATEQRVASNTPALKFKGAAPLAKPLEEEELVTQINTRLADFWQAQGIRPATPASDAEFLRRVYLDLTGRIPMVSEVYAFMDDPGADRRERLVDDLLARRDHATHLAAVWRAVLLPEGVDLNLYGGTNKFDAWLADRFGQNLPYDEIVRQLLLAEGRVSESGPILFYASLKLNPEELAAKTSRVFLGTRMECAQCHDHPFDDRIAQTDFWGFAAHFAQISRPQGKMEMTSPVLRVHDNHHGEVMLPDTETVIAPHLPGKETTASTEKTSEGTDLSRRRQLVDWLTNQNNDLFARAAVNRVWQQLFGRGLVDPVDDMRPDNPAVCPEVLDLLTRDFAASGFDLRRLLRALVLTDAYQLSSGSPQDEPSQALCFARMNMKNFTADQLFDCIAVATRNEGMLGNAPDGALARTENMSRQAFIEQFRAAGENRTEYQAGVPQALTLMHGSVVHGATDLKRSGLLKSLNAPFFTDEQRLDTLFLATLSRQPEPTERAKLLDYLESANNADERLAILGDVLWALLNSAEFTFIH